MRDQGTLEVALSWGSPKSRATQGHETTATNDGRRMSPFLAGSLVSLCGFCLHAFSVCPQADSEELALLHNLRKMVANDWVRRRLRFLGPPPQRQPTNPPRKQSPFENRLNFVELSPQEGRVENLQMWVDRSFLVRFWRRSFNPAHFFTSSFGTGYRGGGTWVVEVWSTVSSPTPAHLLDILSQWKTGQWKENPAL